MHLEPDAVAEAVEEALLEHLARLLRELRLVPVLLEELADGAVRLGARDAGPDGRVRDVECLAPRLVIANELFRRLAENKNVRVMSE